MAVAHSYCYKLLIIHYQLCQNNSLIYVQNYACGNQNPQDLVLLYLHTFNIKKAGITFIYATNNTFLGILGVLVIV